MMAPNCYSRLTGNCNPIMYTHPFALLTCWPCDIWLPYKHVSNQMPCWLPCHRMCSALIYPTGSLEPRVPLSSVQMLIANYLNSCLLSSLSLPHKRKLKSQWGAALRNPDCGKGCCLVNLNKVCLIGQLWKWFSLESNKKSWGTLES